MRLSQPDNSNVKLCKERVCRRFTDANPDSLASSTPRRSQRKSVSGNAMRREHLDTSSLDRGELAREGALPGALRLGFAAAAAALALAFGHYFDWPGG